MRTNFLLFVAFGLFLFWGCQAKKEESTIDDQRPLQPDGKLTEAQIAYRAILENMPSQEIGSILKAKEAYIQKSKEVESLDKALLFEDFLSFVGLVGSNFKQPLPTEASPFVLPEGTPKFQEHFLIWQRQDSQLVLVADITSLYKDMAEFMEMEMQEFWLIKSNHFAYMLTENGQLHTTLISNDSLTISYKSLLNQIKDLQLFYLYLNENPYSSVAFTQARELLGLLLGAQGLSKSPVIDEQGCINPRLQELLKEHVENMSISTELFHQEMQTFYDLARSCKGDANFKSKLDAFYKKFNFNYWHPYKENNRSS